MWTVAPSQSLCSVSKFVEVVSINGCNFAMGVAWTMPKFKLVAAT